MGYYTVIDVREPEEYVVEHVKGAINIPLGHLVNGTGDLDDISKDANLIVYCRRGIRANKAKSILQELGFKNVKNGVNKERVETRFSL